MFHFALHLIWRGVDRLIPAYQAKFQI